MNILRQGTCVAICDGSKAMLLENAGDRHYPKLEMREVHQQKNSPAHDLGASPPGRAFAGERRAAMEQTDFHELAERKFLEDFAGRINQLATERMLDLILVAPPRALGILRSQLSDQARRTLVAEIPRDYVKMPLYEIEKLLAREIVG
jgi:protein required for attachment to host cells